MRCGVIHKVFAVYKRNIGCPKIRDFSNFFGNPGRKFIEHRANKFPVLHVARATNLHTAFAQTVLVACGEDVIEIPRFYHAWVMGANVATQFWFGGFLRDTLLECQAKTEDARD